jgi:hypothetical protein
MTSSLFDGFSVPATAPDYARASSLEGELARDAGTAQVLIGADEWRDKALAVVEQLARELPEFTADDLREHVTEAPPHVNCWGAVMLAAAKRNWIRSTDRTRKSTRAAAHAHRNPVWESMICEASASTSTATSRTR